MNEPIECSHSRAEAPCPQARKGHVARRSATWGLSVTLALTGLGASAAPRVPATDATVVERLAQRTGDAESRDVAALRQRLKARPGDSALSAELASRLFDLAMAQGDPRQVGRADAVLAKVPEPLTPELLLVRGQLRQYRHQFEAALADFAQALKQDPGLAQAHAWRAAIFLVQARYDEALTSCAALKALARPAMAGGCLGLTLAYTGQMDAGRQQLEQALAQSTTPEQALWLNTRLGEVAAWQGRPADAERHYRAALALGLDDGYLLAAWADFLLDQQRPAEVSTLLARWEESDNLLLRLAEAAALQGRSDAARLSADMLARFAAAQARGDTTHRAEEARHALRLQKNPRKALELAAANHAVQREPRDARILLEAAVAAGQRQPAESALQWMKRTGFEDARLRELARQVEALK